jgi:hypothetical protein
MPDILAEGSLLVNDTISGRNQSVVTLINFQVGVHFLEHNTY